MYNFETTTTQVCTVCQVHCTQSCSCIVRHEWNRCQLAMTCQTTTITTIFMTWTQCHFQTHCRHSRKLQCKKTSAGPDVSVIYVLHLQMYCVTMTTYCTYKYSTFVRVILINAKFLRNLNFCWILLKIVLWVHVKKMWNSTEYYTVYLLKTVQ